MASDTLNGLDGTPGACAGEGKLSLKPLFIRCHACHGAPSYKLADFANALNWITQEILPRHRWVLDEEADCFGNIRVNLVALQEEGRLRREAADIADTVEPGKKESLVRVFGRYLNVALAGDPPQSLNPKPAVPMRLTVSPFQSVPDRFAVSAEVILPSSPWVEVRIPGLSKLVRPLKLCFDRRGVLAELEAQGFGDLSGLSRAQLLEFRRSAFGLYPLNRLTVYASAMRDEFWGEACPAPRKKDRDEEAVPSP